MIVKLNATTRNYQQYVNLANATKITFDGDTEKPEVTVYWNFLENAVDGEGGTEYDRFHGDQARQLIGALDRLSV